MKGILLGSTAIEKTNASALELSPLWFRKRVCVWRGGLEVWGGFCFAFKLMFQYSDSMVQNC